jgi:hypothetical protein
MLTVLAMFGAPLHFEVMQTSSIAVTAARTTGAVVMDSQLDLAQWALSLDN